MQVTTKQILEIRMKRYRERIATYRRWSELVRADPLRYSIKWVKDQYGTIRPHLNDAEGKESIFDSVLWWSPEHQSEVDLI